MSQKKFLNRRNFITSVVTAGAVTQISAFLPSEIANAKVKLKTKKKEKIVSESKKDLYSFFTPTEGAFTVAFVDILIPQDDLSPSASQCGVHIYIDRQLGGAFGRGDRLYRQGPWKKGLPTQGYQLPLTPAELIQTGIRQTNTYCQIKYQAFYDFLEPAQKESVIKDLSENKVEMESVSSKLFFDLFYQLTVEGFFSDPVYGGNKNKAAWKMIGYPGVAAIYSEYIEKYKNKKFYSDSLSIEDLS